MDLLKVQQLKEHAENLRRWPTMHDLGVLRFGVIEMAEYIQKLESEIEKTR